MARQSRLHGGRLVGPRLRRVAWMSAAAIAALLLALVLFAAWVARTPSGANWVLGQVPGLSIEGQRGSLHGGPFAATRLRFDAAGREVTVEGLSWRDLRWRWRPPGGAWVALHLIEPRARRVVVGPAPASTAATQAPQTLRLPVQARIDGLLIDRLEIAGQTAPLTGVAADLQLGDDAGTVHRITRLQLERDGIRASVKGSIATDAPFALQADAQLAPQPAGGVPDWQATLRASGPLARARVQSTFSGGADQGARLEAQATLAPFEPWPLAALAASTQELDLSALAAGWPRTRLTGRAEIESSGLDQPLRADVRLRNDEPGRWDEGRLPVATLHATLQGRADQRDTIDFQLLAMTLAGGGSVSGAGRWERNALDLTLELAGVQLRSLDARLAALRLQGPVELAARGLPSPEGGPAPAQTTLTGQIDLRGQLDGGRPVAAQARLSAERDATQWRVELPQALLRSGGASAQGEATLTRTHANGAWTAASHGQLTAFDPAVWWPALKAARADAHRLNGRWTLDLAGPQTPGGNDALALLRALRGDVTVELAASRLAGVPLSGRAKLVAGRDATLAASVSAADNKAQIDARFGSGNNERWQAKLQAPTLAALAPIAQLHPALARWWPRAGALQGDFSAEGRWPALATSGQAQVRGLIAGATQVERADLRWQFSATQPDAPLRLDVDAAGLVHDGQRIDTLKADGQGTLRAHRITLDAASAALRPPAWVEQVQPGAAGTAGTALRLQTSGAWQPAREGGGRWQGRIAELLLRERATQRAPWLAARELGAALQFNPAGALTALNAEPGRVELLGAALRWRELAWQPGVRIALDADLEPLSVAPFLARLQPEWGWGGDLSVTGRFVAKQSTADGVTADFVLERRAGDLQLTDDFGLTQALGLTDLRLGLVAQAGTWHFTQAVAGANLGVLAGAQSLRVARDALWPPPQTPLEGVLEWRVDNLGVWAPFAPPGWRLGGRLHTSAAIGGRFGAPEYTGRVVGSGLAARNLLEGIDLRDGDLAISLRGPDARIDHARFKGGDGELRLTGGASFGEQPRAQLQLVAERFQLLGRFDRRIVTSGSADVALTREALNATGRFGIDEGLIDFSRADAPTLDSDVIVVRRASGASAPPSAEPRPPAARAGPLAQADVKVELDLGEKLRVRGRGLDALLRGRLAISTPGGRLAVNGSVRAEQGTYAAYGQKLEIERGILRFAGDVATPQLDIAAVRPNMDVRVGVVVAGTAANPRVRLYSEPEMSDMDRLSWLVLGRGPDGLGRTDTALLQRAALALLAGERAGPTDKVLAQLGLDELSLRQTENGEVRDTVITLGKQLSQRWYLGYERGVNSTTGTWQLIYRIAQRFTLRAQSGSENSLDLIWTWRWDELRRREPGARPRDARNGPPQ